MTGKQQNKFSVAILSHFALYSGHHLEWTWKLGQHLSESGLKVHIICTHGGAMLRKKIPLAKVTEVNTGFTLLHKFARLSMKKAGERVV